MKKIKYLVFFLVLAFASCEDATNIIQDGEVNDVATFTSTGQMRAFLMEAYDKLDGSTNASNGIAVSSILTDEVGVGRGGSVTDLYRLIVNVNNPYSSAIWFDNYLVINFCNRIIRGSALVTPVDAADQLAYNDIIAQARALRAYSHLQLLTYFSTDMKNDNALGVILMDRVPTLQEQLPRNTNGEVFALINADLDYAYANVQPTPISVTPKTWTFVSKAMISAVRARMYAYRGQYALAEQYATTAIADSGVGIADGTMYTNNGQFYAIAGSNNQYKRMFQDISQGEMIWSIGRIAGKTSIASVYAVNATTTAGVTLYDMNRNLFNILDNGATAGANPTGANPVVTTSLVKDIRRFVDIDQTLYVPSVGVNGYLTSPFYQSTDNLTIDKYSGIAGAALINDIKAFRISEMVLIQAEGRAAAGDYPGVATLLKSIRDKRTVNGQTLPALPVYANATAAWADILHERRLELAFEGHRYIDVKRLGALAGGVTFDRHPLDCSTYSLSECALQLGDYRFTLPIPLNEISGNAIIGRQQNPGY